MMYLRDVPKGQINVLYFLLLAVVLLFSLPVVALLTDSSATTPDEQTAKNMEAIRTSLSRLNTTSQNMAGASSSAAQMKNPSDAVQSETVPTGPASQKMMGKMMGMKGNGCRGKMCKMGMSDTGMMGMPPQMSLSQGVAGLTQTNTPHLFHIGETDFFLDYAEKIKLDSHQITTLTQIKQTWENEQEVQAMQLKALEQTLWQQTGSADPDLEEIRQTIQNIEQLSSTLRLKFIFQVSDASAVLNAAQIEQLKQWIQQMGSPL